MYVCMYIYIYAYIHIYTYICMHMCVCICVCIYAKYVHFMHTSHHMQAYTYTCTHTHQHVRLNGHVYSDVSEPTKRWLMSQLAFLPTLCVHVCVCVCPQTNIFCCHSHFSATWGLYRSLKASASTNQLIC